LDMRLALKTWCRYVSRTLNMLFVSSHSQMLGGAIIPGRPVANMYFTMYGFFSL
jgi:hypothetical protein